MYMASPNRAKGSQFPAMVREGPLYNLNFDEVPSHFGHTGKPLHNMHVDELLKNVISSAENGQLVPNTSNSFPLGGLNGTTFSNNKSMNEMWREMVQQQQFKTSMENNHLQLQQSSVGEIEDYYVPPAAAIVGNHENVIADGQPLMPIDPMVMVSLSQQQDWLPLPMQMTMQVPTVNIYQQEELQHQHQFSVSSELVYENPVIFEMGYPENSMVTAMSSTCSDTKGGGGGGVGRKRMYSDEMMEKTIERRQKRMAKNRESAAKSRAKKQAYINQLEADKERLLRTNSLIHKWKEVKAETTLTPRYQLRRTSSMPQLHSSYSIDF